MIVNELIDKEESRKRQNNFKISGIDYLYQFIYILLLLGQYEERTIPAKSVEGNILQFFI